MLIIPAVGLEDIKLDDRSNHEGLKPRRGFCTEKRREEIK